jgi:hypothetical protein
MTTYNTGQHTWQHGTPTCYENAVAIRWMLGPCPLCGMITVTYGGGYSCNNDYCPKAACNFACNAGPKPDWWNTGVQVFKDGNAWCATGSGFINLQESPAGFGDRPCDAVAELRKATNVEAAP